jgi:hypothetical protein
MLRHAKSPSKYTSLARLVEIQANHYCGRDGQDYEASEVDRLIAAKADKLSDDAIEAWLDYNEQLSAHEAELEAEYCADMDSTLLESTPAETGDGSISAAACAPWTALVIEYTTALVRRAWGFFSKGSNMKAYIVRNGMVIAETETNLASGSSIIYSSLKINENINASRKYSLRDATNGKILRAKKYEKQFNNTQNEIKIWAKEINQGEFLLF